MDVCVKAEIEKILATPHGVPYYELQRRVCGFWEPHTLHASADEAVSHLHGGFAADYPADEARVVEQYPFYGPMIVIATRNESCAVEQFGDDGYQFRRDAGFI